MLSRCQLIRHVMFRGAKVHSPHIHAIIKQVKLPATATADIDVIKLALVNTYRRNTAI